MSTQLAEDREHQPMRNRIDISYTKWNKHGEKDEPSISTTKPVNATTEFVDEINFASDITTDGPITVEMVNATKDNFDEDDLVKFQEILLDAEKPLYEGCHDLTKLSVIVKLLNLKGKYGCSDKFSTELLGLLKKMLPAGNEMVEKTYQEKKISRWEVDNKTHKVYENIPAKASENQEDTRGRGGKIQKKKRNTTEEEGSSSQVNGQNGAYWKKFNIWYQKLRHRVAGFSLLADVWVIGFSLLADLWVIMLSLFLELAELGVSLLAELADLKDEDTWKMCRQVDEWHYSTILSKMSWAVTVETSTTGCLRWMVKVTCGTLGCRTRVLSPNRICGYGKSISSPSSLVIIPPIPILARMNDSTIELRETFQAWLKQQVLNLDSYTPEPSQCQKTPIYYDDDDDEESSTPLRDIIIFELPLCIAITPDKFIKSSVENHVPNPSESKDECEYDVPDCDDSQTTNFPTFSNPLFNDSTSSDDKSSHEESYLLESLLNRDTLMAFSPMIDSLLDEFSVELIFLKSISPGIDEADCDPEEDIHFVDSLFDPFMEEIDLFLASDGSIPPGIDSDYSDSKGDYLFLERLLHDDPISLPNTLDF
uniref:Reverse transcriptase domain-containing protein n=1 Tax=Tanacetum cinerariifolium TaxID=118510 RepID=A0A6L2P3D0_TANCI|nr:hypothetical protein [Tanacetum cinerariifolium]